MMIQQQLFPDKEFNLDMKAFPEKDRNRQAPDSLNDLDLKLRKFLEKYIKRSSDGRQIIEIKGKLIEFIRGIK